MGQQEGERKRHRPRGRRPLDQFWIDWIRSKVINETPTIAALAEMAKEEGLKRGRMDYPAERSIRRYRDEIRDAPETVQREYRFVYWPETFERGDLPWEAAPFVLELMRCLPSWPVNLGSMLGGDITEERVRLMSNLMHCISVKLEDQKPALHRPSVRFTRWFWRVSLAIPEVHFNNRCLAAVGMELIEIVAGYVEDSDSSEAFRRAIESLLIHKHTKPKDSDTLEVFLRKIVKGRHQISTPRIEGGGKDDA